MEPVIETTTDTSVHVVTTMVDLEQTYHTVGRILAKIDVDPMPDSVKLRAERQFFGRLQPFKLRHNTIELFPSPGRGRGVRATAEIPANVIVTFFPCHALGDEVALETDPHALFNGRLKLYAMTHLFVIPAVPPPLPEVDEQGNIIEVSDEKRRVDAACCFIGSPHATDDPLLWGHMINDAVGYPFEKVQQQNDIDCISDKRFKNAVTAYIITVQKRFNCRFVVNRQRNVVAVVTSRVIAPHEELFVAYGPYYWFIQQYGVVGGERVDDKQIQWVYRVGRQLFDNLYGDKVFSEWYLKQEL